MGIFKKSDSSDFLAPRTNLAPLAPRLPWRWFGAKGAKLALLAPAKFAELSELAPRLLRNQVMLKPYIITVIDGWGELGVHYVAPRVRALRPTKHPPRPKVPNPTKYKKDNQSSLNEFPTNYPPANDVPKHTITTHLFIK